MPLSKELLEILACPQCLGDLAYREAENGLVCEKCGLMYPVKDNIPVLLMDEAIALK